MKRIFLFGLVCAAIAATTPALYAQGGCVSSPENPTALLGLVGSAGGVLVWARGKFKARRRL